MKQETRLMYLSPELAIVQSGKTKYEKELQRLKQYDEVQYTVSPDIYKGYSKIITSGHGYLVVPVEDKNFNLAVETNSYGWVGDLAVYLEEDIEMWAFLDKLN